MALAVLVFLEYFPGFAAVLSNTFLLKTLPSSPWMALSSLILLLTLLVLSLMPFLPPSPQNIEMVASQSPLLCTLHSPFGSLVHSLGLDENSNKNNFSSVLTILFSARDFHLDALRSP